MSNVADASFTAEESAPFEPLFLDLKIVDPDLVAELSRYVDGGPREEFALTALRIGVLALRQARGQLDASTIERECERMLGGLDQQLQQHTQLINQQMTSTLKEYFDPSTGRFQERLERLVRRDGELEQVLRRQIGTTDSELCRTLVSHVGQQSPLFKLLSPSESQGLLQMLGTSMATQLKSQSEVVLRQFSLDNKDGALARLVAEMTEKQGQFTKDLGDKINVVVKEFSLDKDDSALSRLVRNVQDAQRRISDEFSLDNDHSALNKLKGIVEKTDTAIRSNLTLDNEQSALSLLRRELLETLKQHEQTNVKFQQEVASALSAMIARKQESQRSTRHGVEFEDSVCAFLEHLCQSAGDIAQATGSTTGLIKNCKVGDCVLTLGPDSAAPAARIAVEAKEVQGYDLQTAINEIDTARKNREAQVGLFVFSKKTAPPLVDQVFRHGHDVIVVWDAEDNQSDLFLRVGVTLAKALCVRSAHERSAQAADFTKLDAAILEIAKRTADLDKLNGWSETIRGNSEKIMDHVRIARNALDRQVRDLQQGLADLKDHLSTTAQ